MARVRNGRSGKSARHVRLYHYMLESEAWKSLTANARAIYLEIAARYAGPSSNNGRIPYSVGEAAASLKISRATACRALQQLQDRGFIAVVKRGAFSLKTKHASEWRLTEFPCDVSGDLSTKDFMKWRAPKGTLSVKEVFNGTDLTHRSQPPSPWYTSGVSPQNARNGKNGSHSFTREPVS